MGGSLDDPDDWITINDAYVDRYYDASHKRIGLFWLDQLLAHEIEHWMGDGRHVDASASNTTGKTPWTVHTKQCAGME